MPLTVNITSITGQSPYNIYICQSGGTGCYYMSTTSTIPYSFVIPPPYDQSTSYMLKIIDGANCIVSGITSVQ